MSKEKVKKVESPFDNFNLIKGGIVPPNTEDELESDIEDVDPTIIQEEVKDLDNEAERLKAGDEALKKVIDANIKKASKKVEPSTDDELEDSEDDDKVGKVDESGYKSTILALYEKGILDVEADKVEDSEEGFDSAVKETVQKMFQGEVNKLNPEYRQFLDFVQNGGDPKQFLNLYYGTHSWEDFKVESEETQKAAIRESLRLSGDTPEDIEDIVTEWSDNGTLEKRAKTHLSKLQKIEKSQKEQLVRQQEEYAKQEREAQKQHWESFKSSVFDREDVKGFKLTPKVKENLWNFFTVIDKKSGKTGYQEAIENDQEAQLLFGLQAMNKFDISKLEKQVETKVSHKYNNLFKNYNKSSKEKISSGTTEDIRDDNPFRGFTKA